MIHRRIVPEQPNLNRREPKEYEKMRLAMLASAVLILVSFGVSVPQETKEKKEKKEKKPPAPLAVKLNVLVVDPKLNFVNNLPQDQFRVFEDDVPQTISTFQEVQAGDLIIAVDTSLSLRNELPTILGVARLVVLNTLPEKEVMLIRFVSSDKIRKEMDFTSDKTKLIKAIEGLYFEEGQTSIIDAIYVANDEIEKHTKGKTGVRRSLVLITDGEERHSYYKKEQLFTRLHETGLQIFTIGLTKALKDNRPEEKAESFLNRLAQETGGNSHVIDRSTDIGQVIKETMFEIASQYVVGYESTDPARNGKFRKVRVEIVRPASSEKPGDSPLAFVRNGYTASSK
jgi:Ca-activated chloride channel family protein